MNLKRIFGAILAILGIVSLIYTTVIFANDSAEAKQMIVFGSLGILFLLQALTLSKPPRVRSEK